MKARERFSSCENIHYSSELQDEVAGLDQNKRGQNGRVESVVDSTRACSVALVVGCELRFWHQAPLLRFSRTEHLEHDAGHNADCAGHVERASPRGRGLL